MRLTKRMLLIIVPTVLLGLVAVFTLTSLLVLRNFEHVESVEEDALLQRVEATILEDLGRHDDTTLDWAHWTETYDYLGGDNPGYPETNFYPLSYVTNRLSFVLILDPAGHIVNGTAFDPEAAVFLPLPDELATPEARAAIGLPALTDEAGHIVGIVTVDGEPHMVSAWSVLTSDEDGPWRGTMVWGSKVTGAYADELAIRRGQAFQILPWRLATPEQTARLAERERVVLSSLLDDEVMVGELRMDDLRGSPAILVQHSAPRTIYQEGLNAMTLSFTSATLVGLGFLTIGLLLVRRYVTAPVTHLSRRIEEIQAGSQDRSLAMAGDDEVATMATAFGQLLSSLDERERRLTEKNRDLDAFAAVVSHDLLSPLSTLNLSAKALETDLAEGEAARAKENLERIQRTSRGIEDRVRAMLQYARAGREMGTPVRVDVAAVMRSVQADLAADLEKAGANVTVGPMPAVMGNEQLLRQVLQNLLSNAAKYAKPGQPPLIKVEATRAGGDWRVAVHDQGTGFDDSEVPQMLTPFQRLERTRGTPGHGIGLASCARIMERMGGRLELHGEVGVGATATIVLPAA